jgi:hypothetical protein
VLLDCSDHDLQTNNFLAFFSFEQCTPNIRFSTGAGRSIKLAIDMLHDRLSVILFLVLAFSWYSREAAHAHTTSREETRHDAVSVLKTLFRDRKSTKEITLGIIPTGSEALSE